MIVLGVDPGVGGACALYDGGAKRLLTIFDMPTRAIVVNKKSRTRVDAETLLLKLDDAALLGCDLVVIEQVGGLPGQSAPAAFAFGHGAGVVEACCVARGLPVRHVTPQKWKGVIGVLGKRTSLRAGAVDKSLIAAAAVRHVPDAEPHLTGPRGGCLLDRAEAALLAYYGAVHLFGQG